MWNFDNLDPEMRKQLYEEFKTGACEAAVRAQITQNAAAKFFHDTRPGAVEGLGHQIAAVDLTFFHYFKKVKMRSFADNDWVKWILNRYDEFKVVSKGTKIMSGWTRAVESAKFHKSYAS